MMRRTTLTLHSFVWFGVVFMAICGGCRPKGAGPPQHAEPAIPVSHPAEREVTDFVDFTGRTDAVDSVGIRRG